MRIAEPLTRQRPDNIHRSGTMSAGLLLSLRRCTPVARLASASVCLSRFHARRELATSARASESDAHPAPPGDSPLLSKVRMDLRVASRLQRRTWE